MTFRLTVLGSSSALPTSTRYPTAHVLNVHERFFLIDCGEATQIQLRKYRIRFSRINHIFISHLHGDHYFGLFGLISTFSLLGRQNDLDIYGPAGIRKLVLSQFTNAGHDVQFRLNFHELKGEGKQLVLEEKNINVYAFPLKHRITTYGYSFEEKERQRNIIKDSIQQYGLSIREIVAIKEGGDLLLDDGTRIPNIELTTPPPKSRKYVYCSDTAFYPEIIQFIKDADLLYHESTFLDDMQKRASETLHSTAREAAQIAMMSAAKQLLIGHYSPRYKDLGGFYQEAVEVFENVILAEEGLEIDI